MCHWQKIPLKEAKYKPQRVCDLHISDKEFISRIYKELIRKKKPKTL